MRSFRKNYRLEGFTRHSDAFTGRSDVNAGLSDMISSFSDANLVRSDFIPSLSDMIAGRLDVVSGSSDVFACRSDAAFGWIEMEMTGLGFENMNSVFKLLKMIGCVGSSVLVNRHGSFAAHLRLIPAPGCFSFFGAFLNPIGEELGGTKLQNLVIFTCPLSFIKIYFSTLSLYKSIQSTFANIYS